MRHWSALSNDIGRFGAYNPEYFDTQHKGMTMDEQESNIDRLIKARAEIDDALRHHKTPLTILFTDIVGSTAYFDRYGDTAGLLMLHRHAELVSGAISEFHGTLIKTIGDSVMAEFPESSLAVRAAQEIQLRVLRANQTVQERERIQVRVGINSGLGFRREGDVYGDTVNVAARITKRSGPAQILISRPVREAIVLEPGLKCVWLGKITFEGKAEKEDIFEVVWTDTATYTNLRATVTTALARGEIMSPGLAIDDLLRPSIPSTPPGATAAAAPAPAPAWFSGRYEILEEAGSGGMGIVYRARDRETGEVVALKVLKGEIASDQTAMERFKNELRLARKITHKNVCRIYEFNRSENSAYISMEFVEGESLRSTLNRFGVMHARKAVQIAQQICAGLREAHAQGVVHRDLKPENIMLDRFGNVKIMDFGIARSIHAGAITTGTIVGTAAYMAPEQAEGKPAGPRSDIYAAGLVLYEMLTGAVAFSGDTPVAVALKQIREEPPPPRELEPTIPHHLEKVILRCLNKSPEARFATVDELESALTVQPELPRLDQIPEPAIAEHVSHWQRRDWYLVAAAVMGCILFFTLFYRFHPGSAMEIVVDDPQHRQILETALKRLDWIPEKRQVVRSGLGFNMSAYYDLASMKGGRTAHRFLESSAAWYGWFPSSRGTNREADYVVDVKGHIRWLNDPTGPLVSKTAMQRDPATEEKMQQIASTAVVDVLGNDVRNNEPSPFVDDVLPNVLKGGLPGFFWRLADEESGLDRILIAVVQDSRLTLFQERLDINVSDSYFSWFSRTEPLWGRNQMSVALMAVLVLILFFVRNIFREPRSRENLSIAIVAGLIAAITALNTLQPAPEMKLITPVLVFCLVVLLIYAGLNTVLYYARRRYPGQIGTYTLLFRDGLRARAAGLEMLHGFLAGAAFSGAWMSLLSALTLWGTGFVGAPFYLEVDSPLRWGLALGPFEDYGFRPFYQHSVFPLLLIVEILAYSWLLVVLPLSLLRSITERVSRLSIYLSILWLILGTTLIGAMAFPVVPFHVFVVLQAIFLGLIFLKQGVLATMTTVFTIEVMLLAYPLFTIFRRIEPLPYVLAMAAWALLLIVTVTICLRPTIVRTYRRFAAVFE